MKRVWHGRGCGSDLITWMFSLTCLALCPGQTCIPSGGGGAAWSGNTADLAGTWEMSNGTETLVIASDGTVLTDTIELSFGSISYEGEVTCDGQPYPLTANTPSGTVTLFLAIDPYKMTAVNGIITIEEHGFREYLDDTGTPLIELQISGTGRFNSATSITLETIKQPLGLQQEWQLTKVSN